MCIKLDLAFQNDHKKTIDPDPCTILDCDEHDYSNNLNERQKWLKLEEEFNLEYKFDRTLANLEEEADELLPFIVNEHDPTGKDEVKND